MNYTQKHKISSFREKINRLIPIITKEVAGFEGFIIMRNDGLVISHFLPSGVDEYLFSAIAVSIFSLSQKAFSELDYGEIEYIVLHGLKKQLVISRVSREFIICFLVSKEVKLNFILKGIFEVIKKISELWEYNVP